MAYNPNDSVLLKHLYDLGSRIKKVTDDHETRIDTIEKAGYQTASQVDEKINAKLVGSYRPGGSVAFASLPALTKDNVNRLYNVTDAFTTTIDFVEGIGANYPAGTNVAIINTGTDESPVYKYDAMSGLIDTSGFATKVSPAVSGNFAALDENGNLADSGHKHADYLTEHQDITGKADKASNATNGHLASLDENGNLLDSGVAASDVITDVSGKMDKVSAATNGNIATFGENGQIVDSGKKFATDADVKEALDALFPENSGT